jgi:pSer/pThr/pTyr-binding forkhead associated (FHA) protein
MLQFTVFHNDEPIKTYEFEAPPISIGRLPENEIPLASISISRRHARIEQDTTNQYTISDLNSLNGTFINGKKAKKGILSNGDKISVGKYAILFEVALQEEIPEEETNTLSDQVQEVRLQDIDLDKLNESENEKADNTEKEKDDDVEEIQVPQAPVEEKPKTPVLIETNKHVVYTIDKKEMTIGSSEEDDVFVEGFLISDGHAIIEKEGDTIWIHGKKLMGRFKINNKKVNKHKLKHKDQIEIGTSTFRYMENGQK